jgi:DNA-binding CsgD family transcriptional regulator
MADRLRLGLGRHTVPVPAFVWHRLARAAGRQARASLHFMTAEHERVRDLAVLELARTGMPLSPKTIAERLDLATPEVRSVLTELERRLTFLYRSGGEDVTWAYPVTVEETPHHARFSTGEEAYSP